MADAEVVPIGTRGRPGRGTGSARPSAAARNLAAGSRTAKRPASAPVPEPSVPKPSVPEPSVADGDQEASTPASGATLRPDGTLQPAPTRPAGAKSRATRPRATKPEASKRATTKPRAKTASAKTPEAAKTAAPGTAEPTMATSARRADADAPRRTEAPKAADPGAGSGDAAPGDGTSGTGGGLADALAGFAAAADGITEVFADRLAGGLGGGDWLAALHDVAQDMLGEDWQERLAEVLGVLSHRLSGEYDVDEFGFDQELTERFLLSAVRPLAEKWFRVEVRGAENIPSDGGALLVSNHSGTIPLDGLVTMVAVHDHAGRNLRPLGADLVFRLPVIGEMARKSGATLACNEDAERMLRGGELVGVWPEGFKGIGKPYSERYKLQRFGRGGFVAAAMRTGVPIVPCSVVGAEEIYPMVGNVPSLARLLGVPYVPITPFFPWLGLLGLVPLPSKWLIEFGEPIRTDSYDEGAADDPMLVFNVTDQVRETIQQTLYTLLVQRRSVFY